MHLRVREKNAQKNAALFFSFAGKTMLEARWLAMRTSDSGPVGGENWKLFVLAR